MPKFSNPSVIGIGLAKIGDDFAVAVNFVGDNPGEAPPDRILGVKVVYRFNVGKKVAL